MLSIVLYCSCRSIQRTSMFTMFTYKCLRPLYIIIFKIFSGDLLNCVFDNQGTKKYAHQNQRKFLYSDQ